MTDSIAQGYLAVPAAGKGPGVLVLHAWWGLNDTIRTVCDRLAEAGYVAFAPDLYRGEVTTDKAEAERFSKGLFAEQARVKADLGNAVQHLMQSSGQAAGPLAVIGFSLGAYYALSLANVLPKLVRAVTVFYGSGGNDHSNSQAAYLGHFAENDPFEPQTQVDQLEQTLKQAGRPVHFYQYAGTGHWFFEPDRSDAYNEAAAALAWERTLSFLKQTFKNTL